MSLADPALSSPHSPSHLLEAQVLSSLPHSPQPRVLLIEDASTDAVPMEHSAPTFLPLEHTQSSEPPTSHHPRDDDNSLEPPFLSTWLAIPPLRAGWIPRRELLRRLSAALTMKLTLLISEPGFGKTALLAAWSHSVDRPPASIAWIHLEEENCHPTRFWPTLLAALKHALPCAEPLLVPLGLTCRQRAWKSLLVGILQVLEQVQVPLVLVFDNFHKVEDLSIQQGLTYLVDHLPAHAHVIVSGRTAPPLPLHHWRVSGELLELRTEHLRLTLEETQAMVAGQPELSILRAEVKRLHRWSEGWLAGLKLGLLLLLEGMPLETLTGTRIGEHRHFSDYLLAEVLFRQPDDVQQFLLETCVLEDLVPSCCDWVTGRPGSKAMLERLEGLHLFLVLEVQALHRYRYHHLLAEALQKHLSRTDPGRLQTCHRRAARWYERQHIPSRALAHALAGEDFPYLDHLLERARLAMRYRLIAAEGELNPLLPSPAEAPEEASPRLLLSVAWTYLNRGQARQTEQWLQQAERALEGQQAAPEQTLDILMLRGYLTRPRPGEASRLERQQLEQLAAPELGLRPEALAALARTHFFEGDVATSSRALRQALDAVGSGGEASQLSSLIIGELVSVLRVSGRVRPAIELLKTVLTRAPDPPGGGPLGLHMKMALLRYELNELEVAQEHLQQEVRASELAGSGWALANTWTLQSRIRAAQGDTRGALEALDEAERHASATHSLDLQAGVAAQRARLAVSLQDQDMLQAWQQWREHRLSDDAGQRVLPPILELEALVLARISLLEGQPADVLARIASMQEDALAGDRMLRVLELWLLSAQAHHLLGDEEQALAKLEQALSFAEPQGLLRVFLEEGPALTPLLRRMTRMRVSPARAAFIALLEAGQRAQVEAPGVSTFRLYEPLKDRELQILRAVGDGLSNGDVALELELGLNTVKWYLKGIFSKLRASNRTEAVARARLLGLIRT